MKINKEHYIRMAFKDIQQVMEFYEDHFGAWHNVTLAEAHSKIFGELKKAWEENEKQKELN